MVGSPARMIGRLAGRLPERARNTLAAGALALLVILVSAFTAWGIGLLRIPQGQSVAIQFVTYSQAGLPEQDVFVEPANWLDAFPASFIYPLRPHKPHVEPLTGRTITDPDWPSTVVRASPADAQSPAFLSKMLYASKHATPHDPYQTASETGSPLPKGDELGFTLREWLAARGSGSYTVDGAEAELQLVFANLVPLGKYSLWCLRVRRPLQNVLSERPCGAADGSQNKLQSGARGEATLRLKLKALPESGADTDSVLQLEYNREVPTEDGDLGGYGLNEHVQLHAVVQPSALAGQ